MPNTSQVFCVRSPRQHRVAGRLREDLESEAQLTVWSHSLMRSEGTILLRLLEVLGLSIIPDWSEHPGFPETCGVRKRGEDSWGVGAGPGL